MAGRRWSIWKSRNGERKESLIEKRNEKENREKESKERKKKDKKRRQIERRKGGWKYCMMKKENESENKDQ